MCKDHTRWALVHSSYCRHILFPSSAGRSTLFVSVHCITGSRRLHTMPSVLSRAVLAGGLAHQAYAYTQVNVATPFMYKTIDPIVFPGEYTKSHLHSFFGSDAVTASTNTSAELQEGCTNAENPNDLSVYCESGLCGF